MFREDFPERQVSSRYLNKVRDLASRIFQGSSFSMKESAHAKALCGKIYLVIWKNSMKASEAVSKESCV